MKIELLGTGGYFANARRHTACVLLPEWGIVFDAGSGLFRLPGRCPSRNVHLFLTHPHLDHIVGLPFLLMPVLAEQLDEVTVHATTSTLQAVRDHIFAEAVFPVPMPFLCDEITAPGQLELKFEDPSPVSVRISWQALPSHPGHSMAYRVDVRGPAGDCSMAYVTDTCVDGTYTEFIADVDLLIHECYFADGREELAELTGHSCASQVARLALAVNAQRLIVVHVDPNTDQDDPLGLPGMQAIFPQIELGIDGMKLEITGRDSS